MSAARNKGLGRGLGALFEDAAIRVPVGAIGDAHLGDAAANGDAGGVVPGGVSYIDIHDIRPNAKQPRKYFQESAIDELAESIKAYGVIQPVIVRAIDLGYELVAGERRWRAAKKAGLKSIPCILREIDERQNVLIALIENMQREDLNPIEEASAINELISGYALTQEEVSKSVGKSRPYISNALRLLKLPEEVRAYIVDGRLSSGHGKAVASVSDPAKQKILADYLVKNNCSVREAELLAADPRFGEEKRAPKRKAKSKSSALLAVEEELRGIFGTKVNITLKGAGGKIELCYYSRDELEGLIDMLRALSASED
jgi:ParB family chromosome partitioning protein